MPQLAYVTPNDEMQIVDKHSDGSKEVYNFKSIYSDAHSHIHYDSRNNKTVYRSLENPDYDTHKFYPRPEAAQYGAIPRDSVYDFDYKFEQIRCMNLDMLTREQLEQLQEYLMKFKLENADITRKSR